MKNKRCSVDQRITDNGLTLTDKGSCAQLCYYEYIAKIKLIMKPEIKSYIYIYCNILIKTLAFPSLAWLWNSRECTLLLFSTLFFLAPQRSFLLLTRKRESAKKISGHPRFIEPYQQVRRRAKEPTNLYGRSPHVHNKGANLQKVFPNAKSGLLK